MTVPPQQEVLVLDNGGCTIKAGSTARKDIVTFPNCIAKVKGEHSARIGASILECPDLSSLTVRRPIERGYLVNTQQQRDIWAHTLSQVFHKQSRGERLLLTEPPLNLPSIQEATDQIVFEDLGFSEYWCCQPGELSLHEHVAQQPGSLASQAQCGLVVDAGFSFTHALPIFDGQLLESSVRRIDLGGKALTNYFKELVSYRSVNMMDESFLIETVKEAACFVSQDVRADLKLAHSRDSPHRREFVLPDGLGRTSGYLRDPSAVTPAAGSGQQVLRMNNERFMVPEALFRPADIGLNQAGLAETIVQAVKATHEDLHGLLYSNVLLTGGTVKCPGFKDRLLKDLRQLVPIEYELNVHLPEAPELTAIRGGVRLAGSSQYRHLAWSKRDYEERGSAHLHDHPVYRQQTEAK